jgi:hypothetical protein
MGRARDLAATAAAGTLTVRVDALEAHDLVLDGGVAAAAAAAAAANAAAGTAQTTANGVAARPTPFSNFVDNFTNVPIGQPLQSFWRAVHHIDLANVKTGDKYLVVGQGQVRSDWDFNVECLPWLSYTTSLGALAHDATGHMSIGPYAVGRNVRQTREHYFDWTRTSLITFGSNITAVRLYNNLRCRSSDPAIDGSGNQALIVGPGQGGIQAFKLN